MSSSRPSARRYPLEPLAAAMGVPLSSLGRLLGMSGSTWKQSRDDGVTELVADRLAVKAGLHPFVVWPEMVDHQVEDERARRRAVAAAAERRRYHSDPVKRARKNAARRAYYEEYGEYERARERAKPYDPAARRARYERAKARAGVAV